VLGYDVDPRGRVLLVNQKEAKRVREIFQLYEHRHSVTAVLEELERRRWTTKSWTTKTGARYAGHAFTQGILVLLLTDAVYVGNRPSQTRLHSAVDLLPNLSSHYGAGCLRLAMALPLPILLAVVSAVRCPIPMLVPVMTEVLGPHPLPLSESTHCTSSSVIPSGPSKNRTLRLM
jgi:hypothetical protein